MQIAPIKEDFKLNDELAPPMSSKSQLRAKACRHIEEGAVTPSYGQNREAVIALLNEALATELVCVLRYKRHYFTVKGIKARVVAEEFLEHAKEEAEHADRLAGRIVQLGGKPDFNPDRLSQNAHSDYDESDDLKKMLEEDLIAERVAIESYREMIQFVGPQDPTTRAMLEDILANEEQHADELAELLEEFKSA